MRLDNLTRPRAFEVSCGKISKIIFILFFITFSPCVFWSQHASSLLLSPFNRCLKHMEGKSVLALARSNITMRKFLNVWNEVFNRTIFRRPHAALFFCAPFLPFFHTVVAGIYVTHVSRLLLSKSSLLCVCGHWSTIGPQLKPTDKNIVAVSAGRKRIRSLQTGPFQVLTRQTCEGHAVSHLAMERISVK